MLIPRFTILLKGLLIATFLLGPTFSSADEASLAQPSLQSADSLLSEESQVDDARLLQEIAQSQLTLIAQTAQLNEKEQSAIRAQLGRLSYLAVKSVRFVGGKAKLFLFEYPDAIIINYALVAAKYLVIIPALIATGHEALATLTTFSFPEPVTAVYIAAQYWIKKYRLRKSLGIDPSLLKAELFKDLDLDLNRDRIYSVPRVGDQDSLLVAIRKSESGSGLREQMNQDPAAKAFLQKLERLNLDESLFETALLRWTESDPRWREILERQRLAPLQQGKGSETAAALEFYVHSNELIDTLRVGSLMSAPSFSIRSFDLVKQFVLGIKWKIGISKRAEAIRIDQLKALADFVLLRSQGKMIEANQVISSASAKLAKDRSGLDNEFKLMRERLFSRPSVMKCSAVFVKI